VFFHTTALVLTSLPLSIFLFASMDSDAVVKMLRTPACVVPIAVCSSAVNLLDINITCWEKILPC
jgi:hypothetical protein